MATNRNKDMKSPHLTPKGESMPQTIAEWKHLAGLYEAALILAKEENSNLRQKINQLQQGRRRGRDPDNLQLHNAVTVSVGCATMHRNKQ